MTICHQMLIAQCGSDKLVDDDVMKEMTTVLLYIDAFVELKRLKPPLALVGENLNDPNSYLA